MQKVERSELLDLGAYEQIRPHFRGRMIEAKKRRRVSVGDHMSLVFENHDTVLLQIQEMLRTERISDEKAIAHEMQTYNDLLPDGAGVSATMFIEYNDEVERRDMLRRFATLRDKVHLNVGGERYTARFAVHFGEEMDRIPAINYLQFDLPVHCAAALRDDAVPANLQVEHPDYPVTVELTGATREELAADLEA